MSYHAYSHLTQETAKLIKITNKLHHLAGN